MASYRGWKIERVKDVRHTTGYGRGRRSRKISGWWIYYPDSDGSRWCDTLTEAREYIDRYEGVDNPVMSDETKEQEPCNPPT